MDGRGLLTASATGAALLLIGVSLTGRAVETEASPADRARSVVVVTGAGSVEELVAGPLGDAVVTLPPSGVAGAAFELELLGLELERLVILGGPDVVSADTAADLATFTGVPVARLAGPDRYATAARAATSTFARPVRQVLIATVAVSRQAVSAATDAAADSPVLLVTRDHVPATTATALRRLQPETVTVLGDATAVPDAVVRQLRKHTEGRIVRLVSSARRGPLIAAGRAGTGGA